MHRQITALCLVGVMLLVTVDLEAAGGNALTDRALRHQALWKSWSFDPGVFYGCAAASMSMLMIYSFAMGPGGPAFFFGGSGATALACGTKAITVTW